MNHKIQSALISVFYKEGLDTLAQTLHDQGIKIYSTGGTRKFIEDLNIPVVAIEDLTSYPSILGGRVKTLHPKVFGGILARREESKDMEELGQYAIPTFDLVIVDLYPFNETVANGGTETDIIEKIDIGGISLIRAAAKNFKYTTIISDKSDYSKLENILISQKGELNMEQRKSFASKAFYVSSNYDGDIADWFDGKTKTTLRYGENPHQEAYFKGNLEECFEKIQGKDLSYNNLLDVDSAVSLLSEFDVNDGSTFLIIKHNNACGLATRKTVFDAWTDALAGDPVSAFGGILACNHTIDGQTATEINKLFFEVLMAPDFTTEAKSILAAKGNRILLKIQPSLSMNEILVRTALNGELVQVRDNSTEKSSQMKSVTKTQPTEDELKDLEFAVKVVKQTKSNTIVLAKNQQLLASGTGQTSRVDALLQAIEKANKFGFDLRGAVMASDAFFPFPDCVEIADQSGITVVVQPGGSLKDQASIDYCDDNQMAMVFTGVRHFKH